MTSLLFQWGPHAMMVSRAQPLPKGAGPVLLSGLGHYVLMFFLHLLVFVFDFFFHQIINVSVLDFFYHWCCMTFFCIFFFFFF